VGVLEAEWLDCEVQIIPAGQADRFFHNIYKPGAVVKRNWRTWQRPIQSGEILSKV
jgi:hypothetical protein